MRRPGCLWVEVVLIGHPAVFDPTFEVVVDQHRNRMLAPSLAKTNQYGLLATIDIAVA